MSIWGIVAGALAGWGFGGLYYSLMHEFWRDGADLPPEVRARIETTNSLDPTPFFLALAAEMLMAVMLSFALTHFTPASTLKGALIGLSIWLGFIAPTLIVSNAYAMRALVLTAIDAFHWLGVLVIMGAVIGAIG